MDVSSSSANLEGASKSDVSRTIDEVSSMIFGNVHILCGWLEAPERVVVGRPSVKLFSAEKLLLATIVSAALVCPSVAAADRVDELGDLLVSCEAETANRSKCERAIWSFADIAKDDKLSRAEIVRFIRLLAEYHDREEAKSDPKKDKFETWVIALLLGPVAADVFLANYDYDGDDRVSRIELYADVPEGKFDVLVSRLTDSGQEALSDTARMALMFKGLGVDEKAQEASPDNGSEPDKSPGENSTIEKNKSAQGKEEDFAARIAKALQSGLSDSSTAQPLTSVEIAAVREQIASCWNLPAGVKEIENLSIEVRVSVNSDGSVRKARVLDQARMLSDPDFRAAAESALQAIHNQRCNPLKLPPEKYEHWKTMTLTFNPREMFGS